MILHKPYLAIASFSGLLAVALGAFGAHGLKAIVTEETVASFQTGVQYQMYHSLALLLIAIISGGIPHKWVRWAGAFFIAGIILFSGSIYLITALKSGGNAVPVAVGVITPFGGVCFMLGWLFLFLGVINKASRVAVQK